MQPHSPSRRQLFRGVLAACFGWLVVRAAPAAAAPAVAPAPPAKPVDRDGGTGPGGCWVQLRSPGDLGEWTEYRILPSGEILNLSPSRSGEWWQYLPDPLDS